MIASKQRDSHRGDVTYLIVFRSLFLRSPKLIFRRLRRSGHRGLEGTIPLGVTGAPRLEAWSQQLLFFLMLSGRSVGL